jgi:hypothetical protein
LQLFFQLVNARYEKGAMILASNRGFVEWAEVFGDQVVATALLNRLLHHASSSRSKAPALSHATARRNRQAKTDRKPAGRAAMAWSPAITEDRGLTIRLITDKSFNRQLGKIGSPEKFAAR